MHKGNKVADPKGHPKREDNRMDLRSLQEILDKTYHRIQTNASFLDKNMSLLVLPFQPGKHPFSSQVTVLQDGR